MRKIVFIFVLTMMLFGCDDKSYKLSSNKQESTVRAINPSDWGPNMYIATVEDHKYLFVSQGGMIHMESCECKQNKEKNNE